MRNYWVGGKELRDFKVFREVKEGLWVVRGQDALAPAGGGGGGWVFYTRARCPRPGMRAPAGLVYFFICMFDGAKIGGGEGGMCANLHFCGEIFLRVWWVRELRDSDKIGNFAFRYDIRI